MYTKKLVPGLKYELVKPFLSSSASWDVRQKYTQQYGYVYLTSEVIATLADILKGLKVLEVASGTGTLGGMLRVAGVDIKLTDAVDVEKNPNNWYGFRKFCELDEVVKVQDVELKGFDVVLLTWGCYNEPAFETLLERMEPGQTLVRNGEGRTGCTETDRFHDLLTETFSKQEELSDRLNDVHVRFAGIYDRWAVWVKN